MFKKYLFPKSYLSNPYIGSFGYRNLPQKVHFNKHPIIGNISHAPRTTSTISAMLLLHISPPLPLKTNVTKETKETKDASTQTDMNPLLLLIDDYIQIREED